jgi:hypothetical protein
MINNIDNNRTIGCALQSFDMHPDMYNEGRTNDKLKREPLHPVLCI